MVAIEGDLLAGTSEAFQVTISNPFRARIADAVGVVTITDNDTEPGVSVGDVSALEGTRGPRRCRVPATGPPGQHADLS